MKQNSLALQIIWWLEVIVAARTLLFTIPVFIDRNTHQGLTLSRLEDNFIVLLTVTAGIYLIVGFISILGLNFWRVTQYGAVIAVTGATYIFMRLITTQEVTQQLYYFYPLAAAAVFTFLVTMISRKT